MLFAAVILFAVWLITQLARLKDDVRATKARLARLERALPEAGAAPMAPPAPGAGAAPPAPASSPARAPETRPSPQRSDVPMVAPSPAASAPMRESPAHAFENSGAEQMLGGIWFQNIGAVLLLFGVFFMIVWGYSTGRLGPAVLMGAGIALGLAFVWRGDRLSRRFTAIGHAVIGVGLGIVYLSLYLGHFTLRVIGPTPAFALLTLAAFTTILVGLRYRAPAVAALGVIGAFVPQILAIWIPLNGFTLPPPQLLGYLAVVNLVVFVLAARAGWSGLDLTSLLLSAFTWVGAVHLADWGWGAEGGLVALYVLLGLAPVPWLVGRATLRASDLAVIAAAPVCLISISWPFLAFAKSAPVAMLLLALAVLYLAAALWVDEKRKEQELWFALVAAATLFLTAALERALGPEHTPMAWCLEGVTLVLLGLGPRRAALRACGYVVSAIGAARLLELVWARGSGPDWIPVLHPGGVSDLVCLTAFLGCAWGLERGRARLLAIERPMPEIWLGAGVVALAMWSGRESWLLAHALAGSGGRWTPVPAVTAAPAAVRADALTSGLIAAAWASEGAWLLVVGTLRGRIFPRFCGYLVLSVAFLASLWGLGATDGWSIDQLPLLYPTGLLHLTCIAIFAVAILWLASRRDRLTLAERALLKCGAVSASALMLAWLAREADHVARAVNGVPGASAYRQPLYSELKAVRVQAAVLTSGGWLVEALALMALGWARRSAFLRWSGLVLCAVTVLKIVFLDMQSIDVFWRFLSAIVVGATLLAISFAYQRRARAARG
jgi:uncharacterized membrane protein